MILTKHSVIMSFTPQATSSSSSGQSNMTVIEVPLERRRNQRRVLLEQLRDVNSSDVEAPEVSVKKENVKGVLMRRGPQGSSLRDQKKVTWKENMVQFRYFEADMNITKEVPLEVKNGIF